MSWITFPSGSTGTGNGALAYQVAANPSGTQARSGTITVTTAAGSATLTVNEAALVSGAPTAAIMNTLTGQAQQTIQAQFTSPNGPAYLNYLSVLVNNTNNGWYACEVIYYPASQQAYFFPNGNAPLIPVTFGVAGTVSGVHCVLDTRASSVVTSQNGITLNLALTLQPSAVGTQNVFLYASDQTYASNPNYYSSQATWSAFREIDQVQPAVANGAIPVGTNQTVGLQFSDDNGFTTSVRLKVE